MTSLGRSRLAVSATATLVICGITRPSATSPLTAAAARPAAGGQSQGVAACSEAQAAIPGLIGSILATIPAADRTAAEATVATQTRNGRSEAAAYDAAAAGAYLEGRMPAAVWAALEAARRGWNARRATNAGVALTVIGQADAAPAFITCARALDPGSWYAIEADAMLAYHRKDCATAVSLIDQVVKLAPRDMNAHYSAGVLHYRCGDRGAARSQLQAAAEIAPTDPVVQAALEVASAHAPSSPATVPMPANVRRQYDEYERFAQDAVAIAGRWAPRVRAIENARGAPSSDIDDELADLHRTLALNETLIAQITPIAGKEAATLGPMAWSSLLTVLIQSYFNAMDGLYDVLSEHDATEISIMAATQGLSPVTLAARMKDAPDGDYAIQDQLAKYTAVVMRFNGTNATEAEICATVEPAYQSMVQTVQGNLNTIDDGFPRAAAAYLDVWIDYALQASDYARRTIAAMRFVSEATKNGQVAAERGIYGTDIRDHILGGVSSELHGIQNTIATMLRDDPETMAGQHDVYCATFGMKPKSLVEALEDLLKAAEAATTFDAEFHKPDCNLEIGGFKVSCKPLAFEGVKVGTAGPVSAYVSAEGGKFRYGVDGSAGTLGQGGGKANLAESSISDSAYGVEASVGVSAWAEPNAAGGADVYMEAKGNLGAGVDIEGIGKADCEFFTAKATFNLRAFAEALTQ